jgi:hypothetical protein
MLIKQYVSLCTVQCAIYNRLSKWNILYKSVYFCMQISYYLKTLKEGELHIKNLTDYTIHFFIYIIRLHYCNLESETIKSTLPVMYTTSTVPTYIMLYI